jgi:hemerythrin-like domain-containing protein
VKNAIELLKEDHKKLKGLLKELVETTTRAAKRRPELLAEIEHELKVHTTIEDEIFYPAFKLAGGSEHKKANYEALEEHRAVDKLVLPDLLNTDPGSEKFSGRAKVLKELVEHHADEEEKEMFKLARKAFSSDELRELGERMATLKEDLNRSKAA